jgi:hypothetical protein
MMETDLVDDNLSVTYSDHSVKTDDSYTSLLDEFDALHVEMDQIHELHHDLHVRMERLQTILPKEEVEEDAVEEDVEDPLMEWMEQTHAECMAGNQHVTDFLYRVLEYIEEKESI